MKLLFLTLLCFALPALAQQSLNSSTTYAQRGETITFSYSRFKSDSSYCNIFGRSYYLCRLGFQPRYNGIVGLSGGGPLNDSTVQFSVKIPNTVLDGQILSFIGLNKYSPDNCDTLINDTAIIVKGGPFIPCFLSALVDTLGRGETKSFLIEAKGMNVKGKKLSDVMIRNDNWDSYTIPVLNGKALNDSQLTGSYFIPKFIPDGNYDVSVALEAGVPPASMIQLVISGGKRIPSMDFITPNQIGRGEEKEFMIYTKGTEFLSVKPVVQIAYRTVEDVTVVNDTTLKCKLKISTAAVDAFYSLTIYNEGNLYLDSAIQVSGGKPLAKIWLDREYSLKRGQKVKVLIKGENTHFTNGGFSLEVSNYYPIMIDSTKVIDSVTMYAYVRADQDYSFDHNYGYYYLNYSDDEISDGVWPLQGIILMPDEKQGQALVVKMEPKYLHANATENYTFTIRNAQLTKLNDEDYWWIRVFSPISIRGPEVLGFKILNDSMMRVTMKFDEFITDSVFAIHFDYKLPGGYLTFYTFATASLVNTGSKEIGLLSEKTFLVYPNPVKNMLIFETKTEVLKVWISDITGKEMQIPLNEIINNQMVYKLSIEPYRFDKGIYFIRVQTDQGIQYQKFIVE